MSIYKAAIKAKAGLLGPGQIFSQRTASGSVNWSNPCRNLPGVNMGGDFGRLSMCWCAIRPRGSKGTSTF